MSDSISTPSTVTPRRRVRPIVALRLLEVIRDQDHPGEVLEDEDPSITMPRRLGLSDVVERQIRSYRQDLKRGVRLADGEVRDLFRLVIRRPDAEEVFHEVGRSLAGRERPAGWRRLVPKRLAYQMARSRVRRGLKRLFGRRVGGFGRGPFSVEGRSLLFIDADPGGEACYFLSGYCGAVLEQAAGRPGRVDHTLCQSRGDDLCRWEGVLLDADEATEAVEAGPADEEKATGMAEGRSDTQRS